MECGFPHSWFYNPRVVQQEHFRMLSKGHLLPVFLHCLYGRWPWLEWFWLSSYRGYCDLSTEGKKKKKKGKQDCKKGPDNFLCVRLPKAHLVWVWVSFLKEGTPLPCKLTLCLASRAFLRGTLKPKPTTFSLCLVCSLLAHSPELSRISNTKAGIVTW